MRNNMATQLKSLPDAPGIYFFYSSGGELLYVGKATSLKSRVASYFRASKTPRPIEAMIHEVARIDWQEADSALEAMILEANAIKKHQPKYNVEGKDDKSWNYICITDESYPRVQTIREREMERYRGDKNFQLTNLQIYKLRHIFGPYPGMNTAATMKVLRKIFHFSTCAPGQKRPCLYYEMGQCLGVCTGKISPKDYRAKVIRPLVTFLSGRKKYLLKQLEAAMRTAAKVEDFEEAGRLRNQIAALRKIQDIALLNQSFVDDPLLASHSRRSADSRQPMTVERIEGYDISNLGATGMVGSMVVFEDGNPEKSDYRKFKIKTVAGQSDVDCLEEVLRRRLNHAEWPYPDLFLIDGGKPQVNRAVSVLTGRGLDIPVIGIAKGPDRKKNEIVFGCELSAVDCQHLAKWVYAHTRLLIAVRDEAHRFAITYQRTLRRLA